jgi:hypothetical protein
MTNESMDQNLRPLNERISKAERREVATAEWNNRTTGNQIYPIQEPGEAPDMGGASGSADVSVGEGQDMNLQKDFFEPMVDKAEVRVAPIQQAPSRQEALEHACTHCPFRSWSTRLLIDRSRSL